MIFESPLIKATLIKRYKRFLADVTRWKRYYNHCLLFKYWGYDWLCYSKWYSLVTFKFKSKKEVQA